MELGKPVGVIQNIGLTDATPFHFINSRTIKYAYLLPLVESKRHRLAGVRWFISLYIQIGYWYVEIEESDKSKTAFIVGYHGFYECNRMLFGLMNAPGVCQKRMKHTLADLTNVLV